MPSVFLCSPSMVMGGAERYLLNLSDGLIAEGNCVTIVLMETKGELFGEIADECQVISINRGRAIKSVGALTQVFIDNSPDIVISFQTHMNVVALTAMAFAKKNIPLVVTEHAPLYNHTNPELSFLTRSKNWVMLLAAKFLYKKAHKLVGVSKGVTQEYVDFVGLSADQASTIPTPIVTPKLMLKAEQPPHHRWLVKKDHPVIVSMGRLSQEKDHFTLLKAFDLLRKKIDARLIIFGEGAERQKLATLIKERGLDQAVDLPGIEMNPFREMAYADLYAQSSIYEGFGNVLVEAMMCGLPVISTDCPVGPGEILSGGKYGVLTPVRDETALAEEMYRVLNLPEDERKKIVIAGKTRANEFSIAQTVESYMEMLCPPRFHE